MNRLVTALGAGVLALGLSACGGESAPAAEIDPAVQSAIKSRQEALKEMGGAMKTISDQLKLEEPDVDAIYASAQTIEGHSVNIGDWFPAGTGPESGVETEALAAIWEKPEDFAAAVARFQTAADEFEAIAVGRDPAAIGPAMGGIGGSCKNCHDQFRLDDG